MLSWSPSGLSEVVLEVYFHLILGLFIIIFEWSLVPLSEIIDEVSDLLTIISRLLPFLYRNQ